MTWHKCNSCGKFISFEDFATDKAERNLVTPDSLFTQEEWENICKRCVHEEYNDD